MHSNGRGNLTKKQNDELNAIIDGEIKKLRERTYNGSIEMKREDKIPHGSEDAQPHIERENTAAMMGRDNMRLRDLIAAKERLKRGVYGSCLGCEEKIAFGRLKAKPEAVHCIDCAEKREKGDEVLYLQHV